MSSISMKIYPNMTNFMIYQYVNSVSFNTFNEYKKYSYKINILFFDKIIKIPLIKYIVHNLA